MSPGSPQQPSSPKVEAIATAVSVAVGRQLKEARLARGWTLRRMSEASRVAPATVLGVEAGRTASLDTIIRLAVSVDLDPSIALAAAGSHQRTVRDRDPVHAAMGEILAEHLRGNGFEIAIDEPYQHYQFAGRADCLAWQRTERAMLHVENRTRLPDIQETAGSFNAKRAYLAGSFARRLDMPGGFRCESHVLVLLWSAEILHTLRMRTETFRALAPDGATAFSEWWDGRPAAGRNAGLVVFDPLEGKRRDRRRWVDLDGALSVKPRYRGYADALSALREAGRA